MALPEITWENKPSRATPMTAENLNAENAWIKEQVGLAEAAAAGVDAQLATWAVDTSDSAVASLVTNTGSATGAALASTYAPADIETSRAEALRPFHAALAARDYAPCDVLVIGDSITEGAHASVASRRWVERLRDGLRTRFPTGVGGEGYRPAAWSSPAILLPAPATLVGSPVANAIFGWGKRGLALTSGKSAEFAVYGTSVDIQYARGTTPTTMAVSVDGAAAVNYSVYNTDGTTDDKGVTSVALGAAGAHTVKVSWFGGGTVFLNGIHIYNGDESKGIRVTESGRSGYRTTDWLKNASLELTRFKERVGVLQPDLVILALGVNDRINNVAPATFGANLALLAAAVREATTVDPSFVVLGFTATGSGYTYPQSAYVDEMREFEASDPRVTVFDFSERLPTATTDSSLGLIAGDGVHPLDPGHAYMADALASFLAPR